MKRVLLILTVPAPAPRSMEHARLSVVRNPVAVGAIGHPLRQLYSRQRLVREILRIDDEQAGLLAGLVMGEREHVALALRSISALRYEDGLLATGRCAEMM